MTWISSRFKRSTNGEGVFAGTKIPYQFSTTKLGCPSSFIVGTFGRFLDRSLPVVAKARMRFEFNCDAIAVVVSKATCTCPASTSAKAGPCPR
ncbi:hypothetical protein D3C87_1845080 [compost metagenome]